MKNTNKPLPSLEELQRKINESKPKGDEEHPVKATHGTAMRLGTDLLAGSAVGGFIGYYIDDAIGTMPLFFILFFFIGFAAGVRNILRKANKVE